MTLCATTKGEPAGTFSQPMDSMMLAILARIAEISRQWVPIQATLGSKSGRGGLGFRTGWDQVQAIPACQQDTLAYFQHHHLALIDSEENL
jgi:hypothetical protein